jgi:predicted acylesterase/phospholipase RssA
LLSVGMMFDIVVGISIGALIALFIVGGQFAVVK